MKSFNEYITEMDKSQTPPGRDGSNDSDAGKKEYTAKVTTSGKVAKDGEKILNKIFNKKKLDEVAAWQRKEGKNPSKSANRRKSFCARMSGMKKRLTSAKTANDPDSRINKSLRKWNC